MTNTDVPLGDMNAAGLFEAAKPGPFIIARITSTTGKGPLYVNFDWLYSSLCCHPNGPKDFYWTFSKTAAGQLTLSTAQSGGRLVFASVRDDLDWIVECQAPGSAHWITAAGGDEFLGIEATGIMSFALKGFNGAYLTVLDWLRSHDGISGHLVKSTAGAVGPACEFVITDVKLVQPAPDYMLAYEPTLDDIQTICTAYNVPLNADEQQALLDKLPVFTPWLLAEHAKAKPHAMVTQSIEANSISAGSIAGGLFGGAIGGIIGITAGPAGIAAGIGIGMSVGANIGAGVSLKLPHADPPDVVDPKIPSVAKTQFALNPIGGPYKSRQSWFGLMDLTAYPQIGSARLPNAGILYPPAADGSLQVWLPTEEKVVPFLVDEKKWPSTVKGPDGSVLSMAIFVVVGIGTPVTKYEFRLHPDQGLSRTKHQPNHSALTRCGKLCGLAGYELEDVYAAGEIYIFPDRHVCAITAKTGHYYETTKAFNHDVTATAKTALDALGYDTSKVFLADKFLAWLYA